MPPASKTRNKTVGSAKTPREKAITIARAKALRVEFLSALGHSLDFWQFFTILAVIQASGEALGYEDVFFTLMNRVTGGFFLTLFNRMVYEGQSEFFLVFLLTDIPLALSMYMLTYMLEVLGRWIGSMLVPYIQEKFFQKEGLFLERPEATSSTSATDKLLALMSPKATLLLGVASSIAPVAKDLFEMINHQPSSIQFGTLMRLLMWRMKLYIVLRPEFPIKLFFLADQYFSDEIKKFRLVLQKIQERFLINAESIVFSDLITTLFSSVNGCASIANIQTTGLYHSCIIEIIVAPEADLVRLISALEAAIQAQTSSYIKLLYCEDTKQILLVGESKISRAQGKIFREVFNAHMAQAHFVEEVPTHLSPDMGAVRITQQSIQVLETSTSSKHKKGIVKKKSISTKADAETNIEKNASPLAKSIADSSLSDSHTSTAPDCNKRQEDNDDGFKEVLARARQKKEKPLVLPTQKTSPSSFPVRTPPKNYSSQKTPSGVFSSPARAVAVQKTEGSVYPSARLPQLAIVPTEQNEIIFHNAFLKELLEKLPEGVTVQLVGGSALELSQFGVVSPRNEVDVVIINHQKEEEVFDVIEAKLKSNGWEVSRLKKNFFDSDDNEIPNIKIFKVKSERMKHDVIAGTEESVAALDRDFTVSDIVFTITKNLDASLTAGREGCDPVGAIHASEGVLSVIEKRKGADIFGANKFLSALNRDPRRIKRALKLLCRGVDLENDIKRLMVQTKILEFFSCDDQQKKQVIVELISSFKMAVFSAFDNLLFTQFESFPKEERKALLLSNFSMMFRLLLPNEEFKGICGSLPELARILSLDGISSEAKFNQAQHIIQKLESFGVCEKMLSLLNMLIYIISNPLFPEEDRIRLKACNTNLILTYLAKTFISKLKVMKLLPENLRVINPYINLALEPENLRFMLRAEQKALRYDVEARFTEALLDGFSEQRRAYERFDAPICGSA